MFIYHESDIKIKKKIIILKWYCSFITTSDNFETKKLSF